MAVKKKYELTDETIEAYGYTLHRIKALRSFGDVQAGEIGGYIEKESNLSHKGECWVAQRAWVFGDAEISGNAWVFGDAQVSGNAKVYGNACIGHNAWIYSNARVYGDARVYDNDDDCRYDQIGGNEDVYDYEAFRYDKISGNEAHKNDDGKARLELVPPLALIEIGKVLDFGAKKYGANNWRNGMDWSRFHGAALRHLLAWFGGESKDAESDLSHLAHAACCLLFLMECEAKQIGFDNRIKSKEWRSK